VPHNLPASSGIHFSTPLLAPIRLDEEVSMRRHITILLASEQRSINPERWTPAFRLVLCYEEIYREPRGPFYPQDKDLIFTTQAEANKFAKNAAREWCAQHYPGWTSSH
jgi:hypothetical protein